MSETQTPQEIIRIEGLGKTFHGAAGDIVALRDIDLTIRQGEIFGIIGLSGARQEHGWCAASIIWRCPRRGVWWWMAMTCPP